MGDKHGSVLQKIESPLEGYYAFPMFKRTVREDEKIVEIAVPLCKIEAGKPIACQPEGLKIIYDKEKKVPVGLELKYPG